MLDQVPDWAWMIFIAAVFISTGGYFVWMYFDERENPSPPPTFGSALITALGFGLMALLIRFPDEAAALWDWLRFWG